jgi:hypothetical protein
MITAVVEREGNALVLDMHHHTDRELLPAERVTVPVNVLGQREPDVGVLHCYTCGEHWPGGKRGCQCRVALTQARP